MENESVCCRKLITYVYFPHAAKPNVIFYDPAAPPFPKNEPIHAFRAKKRSLDGLKVTSIPQSEPDHIAGCLIRGVRPHFIDLFIPN